MSIKFLLVKESEEIF